MFISKNKYHAVAQSPLLFRTKVALSVNKWIMARNCNLLRYWLKQTGFIFFNLLHCLWIFQFLSLRSPRASLNSQLLLAFGKSLEIKEKMRRAESQSFCRTKVACNFICLLALKPFQCKSTKTFTYTCNLATQRHYFTCLTFHSLYWSWSSLVSHFDR